MTLLSILETVTRWQGAVGVFKTMLELSIHPTISVVIFLRHVHLAKWKIRNVSGTDLSL